MVKIFNEKQIIFEQYIITSIEKDTGCPVYLFKDNKQENPS